MIAQISVDGSALWQLAGWTMLHFLWLGTLVGLVAMMARLALRRAAAEVRYGVALVSLAMLAALPVGIGAWLVAKMPVAVEATPLVESVAVDVGGVPEEATPVNVGEIIELKGRNAPRTEAAPGFAGGFVVDDGATTSSGHVLVDVENPRQSRGLPGVLAVFDACVPYLPWFWLVGTPLTFLFLTTGVIGAERLRRGSRVIHDGPIAEACARLSQALGVTRRVTVAVCERIAAPVLVGMVRPVILLPPSALTGWSPDEIEMVLLHELAHVRRWDNFVNLGQRLVESLLFFHPAVWLVSGWVRREREACCDAVVVDRTQRPHAYAEMLVALAAQMPRSVLFHPAASSAMAARPLRARIRRIMKLEDDPMLVSGKSFAIVLAGLVVAATLALLYVPAVGQTEESAAAAEEAATEITEDADTAYELGRVSSIRDALDRFRTAVIAYDLGFDSVFPQHRWAAYDPQRLERYPTDDAWPDVLGHVDRDADAFRVVREPLDKKHETVIGPNAYRVPLSWNIGTNGYATLLFLQGIQAEANVSAHSYTSLACFGPMAGKLFFESYATVLVDGDMPGQITANSYFDLVVTGKFSGRIYCESYAMIYLMGGFEGNLELEQSKVYIAGRTTKADLMRISGVGNVYLEESDIPPGVHRIGQLTVTVKEATGVATETTETTESGADTPESDEAVVELKDAAAKLDGVARAKTQNNLKKLQLALLNYEATYRSFPAFASFDASGKPLLSWRVHILPFLGEEKLYREFRLDEPWDSEHNRRLIRRMPLVFQSPKLAKPGMTNYLGVFGQECMFDGSAQGVRLATVSDGIAHTIAIVEANTDQAVEWTKPLDWKFDRQRPTAGLGMLWGDHWYAAWVDGSIKWVDNSEAADAVGIQFTRGGGESKSLQESEGNRLLVEGGMIQAEFGEGSQVLDGGLAASEPAGEMGVATGLEEAVDDLSADKIVIELPDGEVLIDGEGDRVQLRAGADQSASDRERVIATVPNPETGTSYEEFWKAVDAARAEGLHVDYVPHGETADLVVIPKPTEADWPAMLGDPPRKERVIADKAWERLGLKLVPASRLERLDFEGRGIGGAVKIVGGNVPKGLPLPAFVRRIGDNTPGSFDDLLTWLASEQGRSHGEIKVFAFADGHEYLFDVGPLPNASATDTQADLIPSRTQASPSAADTTQNESADDWPAGVAFPSPKEGEIARRAWKELGIKVVPASEAELAPARRNGIRGGLKLVDFEGRLNLDGPFILTHLQAKRFSSGIADFDALASALDALKSQPADGIVVLHGIAGKGGVFQYSMRLPHGSAIAKSAGHALFPSLEEQRLADLIYKAMDLEVVPIGEEELRRVKALGYEGGVLVAEAIGDAAGRFHSKDILVGLHVWPTTNMQEVVEVLTRDDLLELSPLKYYVVRQGSVADPKSAGNSIAKDFVETGRIPVRRQQRPRSPLTFELSQPEPVTVRPTPADRPSTTGPSPFLAPVPSTTREIVEPSGQPTIDWYSAVEHDPQLALLQQELIQLQMQLASSKSKDRSGGRRTEQFERQIEQLQRQIKSYRESTRRQVAERQARELQPIRPGDRSGIDRPEADTLELRAQRESNTPKVTSSATTLVDPRTETPAPSTDRYSAPGSSPHPRDATAANRYSDPSQPTSGTPDRSVLVDPAATTEAAGPQVSDAGKSRLRYDGRTFEDWRNTWRNELSTDKRMEAVRALAAFGSAGYGKEAAETILEVVKQYDWSTIGGNSPVGLLKDAAILAFGGGHEMTSIPMDQWLPVLAKELRSGDKRVEMFAYYVFTRLNTSDAEMVPRLLAMSRDEAWKSVRGGILQRLQTDLLQRRQNTQLNKVVDPQIDAIEARMVEALGEGPESTVVAMVALYPPSESGMFGGRGMGGGYGRGTAPQPEVEYRPELLDVLGKGEGPLADHLADQVVNALTQLGPKAKPAVPRLLQLLMELDVAIARKLLWTIPVVTGSDLELREYLDAVIEKAESPEKVKRAQAMLKALEKRRQQEAGAMSDGEMGMEGGRGMMMEGEMGRGEMGRAQMRGEGGFGRGEGGRGESEEEDLLGPSE